MSEHISRTVLERMNLREVAVAHHHNTMVADLRLMAEANPDIEQEAEERRRTELVEFFGLSGDGMSGKAFAFSRGVAIIPVSGTLINRFGRSWGFVTGYNFIRSQLNMALADEDVSAIVLDLNSYGGEVGGCFELADTIREARSQKPILGMIDSNCYSACYAIGSACSKLVSTPSGGSGSIGVVAMHVDMSKMYDDFGVDITFIHAGKHKVDGNPFEALPENVKNDIQTGVNKSYDAFVSLVARNRGLDEKVVRGTEARTYRAEDSLSLGLIDAIEAPDEAMRSFLSELSGSKTQEDVTMTTTTQQPVATNPATPQPAAAPAAAPAAEMSNQDARAEERERISSIMSCEEAEGRSSLASHLALKTDMDTDAAKAVLSASPKEAAAPAATPATENGFEAAMNASQHPQVGADGGNGGDDPGESPHLAIIRAQQAASGLKLIEA